MPISKDNGLTYLCVQRCSYHREEGKTCVRLGLRNIQIGEPCPFEEIGRYFEDRIKTEPDFITLFGNSSRARELTKSIGQEPFGQ